MADLKTTNIYGDAYINNKVGINTNTPATRLQIGQLSPTAATEGIQFGDDTSTRIYRGAAGQINFNGTINVLGNTYLGDANGDTVFVNDTIRIGATDSGDASLFFGEGAVAGSDYGARWYWDSGYTFTWYTRNAGTDTALFDYVTNDLNYINWRRHFHMQNKEINYNAQVHFNAGTRFVGSNTQYLIFRSDSGTAGGIQVQDGSATTKGYTGYWDSAGGGILNNTGNWAVRYNFGSANSGGTLYGAWTVNGNISASNLSGTNTGDQTIGNGTITIAAGTGIGVGTSNTFTTNQSGATTVTVTNNGVTSNVAGTGISVSGATGAVTITNSGVTSLTGTANRVTVSAATGAVTLNLPQDIHTGASPSFSGLTVTGITMTNLTGAYQNTTVYDSPKTQSATPSRGIRAPASSIQFTDSYAIAPFWTYRSTGDWPVPYGIGWGTGGESSGIFQRYASNGSSFGDMIFYTGNDGSGAFSFRRHTWEGTTHFAAGSGELNTELFRIDWAGKATAISFGLTGGFVIDADGGYGRFNNWVNLNGYFGLFSGNNNAHIYPNNGSYGSWKTEGTRNGWGGIEFGNNGVSLMMGSDTVGFHQNTNGWLFRVHNGSGFIYKGSWGGGTAATIYDTTNGDGVLLRAAGVPAAYGDWNTFGNATQTTNGIVQEFFNLGSGTGNSNFPPVVAYNYGILLNFGSAADARAQVYISHAGNDLIFRGGWGTASWQTWNRCLTNVNSPYAYNMDQYVRTTDNVTLGALRVNSNIRQGADLAMPLASWSVAGTSTGMVIFSFPGNTSNYGMVHCVFDIYEYNSNTVSTVIVGGHNWNGAWYNFGANVIGRCGKSVRLGTKDSKYCVVFGGAASSWEYGTIILRKIHNGGFYTGIMDMGGTFTTQQTTTESFSNISGDLRLLRTSADFIADGGVTGTSFTGAGTGLTGTAASLSIGGNAATATILQTGRAINGVSFNGSAAITVNGLNYNVNNDWLRENGDDDQFKLYGNSRTMIYRTDGNTNPHGGGAYAHIFYYGGSADANRMFIINTDGRLWSTYHGWLDAMSISGNAATATSADNIDGRPFVNTNSNSATNADTINSNGISYYTGGVTNFSGNATDGALFSQAYSNDWQHQIAGDYRSGQIALRGKNSGTWQSWRRVLDETNAPYAWNMNQYVRTTDNVTFGTVTAALSGNATTATTLATARAINGTNFNGSAAITTATWGTARTITIGSTGKSVDGSANVSWTLAEIGAAATNQTMFIGTTSVAINRASAAITLTGTSIDGNAATATSATSATNSTNASYQSATGTSNDWTQSFQQTPAHATSFREMSAGGPAGTWWMLHNFRHSNSSNYWGTQVAWGWEDNANTMYTRNVLNGAYGSWVKYINSANYTDYTVTKTGTGASGNWAINITGNAATATTATNVTIANGSVTLAKIENITAYTILGNSNASAAATPAALSVATVATMLSGQTMNINGSSTSCSGTAANATTAGGLAVHTGTNNEANKIVRTQDNGYIMAGWINTISGDNGTTAIDRVYASSDGYIRYYTPANFRTVLDVPTRAGSGASGNWAINITGNAATATSATSATTATNVAASGITGQTGMWTSAARPGPYRLYRNDHDSAYNLQLTWQAHRTNYWSLRGYLNDTFHAECFVVYSGYADEAGALTIGNTYRVANLGINVAASNKLHINGDNTNPAIRIDNGALVTGVASNSKNTFQGYLPVSFGGTTYYIRLWT